MKVLVTGASGFVGRAVVAQAVTDPSWLVAAAARRLQADCVPGSQPVVVGDLAPDTDWRSAVRSMDAIVHSAARVHVMRETASSPLAAFRHVNVEGTLALARQAAAAGVRRFVFVSSIKVNGEETPPGKPFKVEDVPLPLDPYGVSKLEAEVGLQQIAATTGMEVAIIRPSLVYGPGVKANFLALLRCVHQGIPLPLGCIDNKRSFIALDNLVSLILACTTHPAAANQTFLAADGEDLSTPELVRRMAMAMDRPARLLPVPPALLRRAAALLGKRQAVQRLCGSLQVDISRARERLNWSPAVSVNDALRSTANDFRGKL